MKTKKRIAMMAVLILLGLAGGALNNVVTYAAEPEADEQATGVSIIKSGTCGDDLTYTIDALGVLTISGTGAIEDKAFQENIIVKKLVLKEGITGIGDYAFAECRELTGELKIPKSVTTIGRYAFYKCRGFTGDLIIPDNVTEVSDYAFADCSGFQGKLSISSGIKVLRQNIFAGCSGLTGNLVIPDSVTKIGSSVFHNCSGFTGKLTIPESVTYIGNYAFYNCIGFTGDLVIPDTVTRMDNGAFKNCTGFNGNLIISENITSIPFRAFDGCTGLVGEVKIPEGVTQIGEYAFLDVCNLERLVIPKSVSSIDIDAFSADSNTTFVFLNKEVQLPDNDYLFDSYTQAENMVLCCYRDSAIHKAWQRSWTNMNIQWLVDTEDGTYSYKEQADGNHILTGCYSKAEQLTLPTKLEGRTITTLSKSVFADCEKLTLVTIPDSITNIDVRAFMDCKILKEIRVSEKRTDYAAEDGVLYNKEKTTLRYVPGGKTEYTIPESVTVISENALADCKDTKLSCYADSYGKEYLKKHGYSYTVVIGKNHVHHYDIVVEQEASCTQSGVRRYTCPDCEGTYTEVIPAKGHVTYITGNAAPTGTTEGYSGDEYCRNCHQLVKKGTVIPKRSGRMVTVKLSGNGGKGKKTTVTCLYKEVYGTLPKAVRKGYTFKGWYTKKSGGTKVTAATRVNSTKTITLYAHWSKVSKPKTKPIKSLSGRNGKLTVKYGKVSGADGYQIWYGTGRSFQQAVKKLTKKTNYTSGKLKKNRVYYVRIRAYKTDSAGNKVYGKWSNMKKTKIS